MKDKIFIVIVGLLVVVLLSIVLSSPPSPSRKKTVAKAALKTAPKKSAKVETSLPPEEASIEQLQEEIQQTKAMITALVDMNAALKKNNSSLEGNIIRLEKTLADAREENLGLNNELEDTTSQKEELLKEMSSLKVVVDELRETTEPIKMKLKNIATGLEGLKETSASKDLKKQLRSLDERLAGVDGDIGRLIKENNAYRVSASSLQGLLSDKNNELESLKKQTTQEDSDKERIKSESSLLSKELEQVRKTRSVFEDTVTELNKKNNSLSAEVNRLNALLNKSQSATRQSQEAIKQRDEAVKARQELEASIASLNTKNQQLEQELIASRAQAQNLNKEYADLKTQFNAYKESSQTNEGELGKRAEEILRLRDKLIVSEAKMDEFKTALLLQEKETAALRERFVAIQLENETLRDELSLSKSKLNDLKLQLSQIVEMNSSLQDRLQEIGGMFKSVSPSVEPQQPAPQQEQGKVESTQPQGKRVDVELVPQQ